MNDLPSKIGILAGSGVLPRVLVEACQAKGIAVFVVAFEGQVDVARFDDVECISVGLGQAGRVIKALKARGIRDLVLIGAIKRPSFSTLKTDLKGAQILAKLAVRGGDSDLLSSLKDVLAGEGFVVRGMQEFVDDALAPRGVLGSVQPEVQDLADIKAGVTAALALGRDDIGQAVIVRGERILREDADGTDAMIARWDGSGGVLVKLCKPQQDKALDLPTIGVDTVRNIHAAGLRGIAVHAGHSFIAELEKVRGVADDLGVFVIGIKPEEFE